MESRSCFLVPKIFSVLGLLLLLGSTQAGGCQWRGSEEQFGCGRLRRVSILDFGAVGDGATLNTKAFQEAVSYLKSFGGGTLLVPKGRWLTGSFNLTSHFTLYFEQGAVIVASQNSALWPVIEPLPSYGRGRELPGGRHMSLIHGQSLQDVVITGENGTIDGQGAVWWKWSQNGKLNFTRGHLMEFISSSSIVISNVTLVNSPFWTIHPVYCRDVLIQGVTILAPQDSPNTDGIDPDSSTNVCIQDCYISNGDDMIAIKSGWDEYGIAFNRPSSNIFIQRVTGQTKRGAGIAIGSETSGGIQNIVVKQLQVFKTKSGISIRTGVGRGSFVRNIRISDVKLVDVQTAITISEFSSEHPDDGYNRSALPKVGQITITDVTGNTLDRPGRILGIEQNPLRNICLNNIGLVATKGLSVWKCTFVQGFSRDVSPPICSSLKVGASTACFVQPPVTTCPVA